jgi:hypothetical protein
MMNMRGSVKRRVVHVGLDPEKPTATFEGEEEHEEREEDHLHIQLTTRIICLTR